MLKAEQMRFQTPDAPSVRQKNWLCGAVCWFFAVGTCNCQPFVLIVMGEVLPGLGARK